MAEESNKVVAQVRDRFGKGAARKIRAAGNIPAVIYGHGTEPVHITVPTHQVTLLLRKANAILDVDVAGASHLVLVKDVQKDPVLQIVEHLDLLVVRRGEKVEVEIPVHVEGESFSGTTVVLDVSTLTISVDAISIPERIIVDVNGAQAGTFYRGGDLALPKGATLAGDPEQLILSVVALGADRSEDAEDATAAAE